MKKNLTIFVSSYNQEDIIFDTLKSLINQKSDKIYKIIVSDDHSTDNSLSLLIEFAKNNDKVRVISPTKNLGIGGNRNFMIQNCQTDYLCFVDGDDAQDEEYVQRIYDALENAPNSQLYKFRNTKYIYENDENLVQNIHFGTVWSMVFNINFFNENLFCTDRIMGADDILFYCLNFNDITDYNNYIEYHYKHYRLEGQESLSRDELKRYKGFIQLLDRINEIEKVNPNVSTYVNFFKYHIYILAIKNNIKQKKLGIKISKLDNKTKIVYITYLLRIYPITGKIMPLIRKTLRNE